MGAPNQVEVLTPDRDTEGGDCPGSHDGAPNVRNQAAILGFMAFAFGAILQPPQGGPASLFQLYFGSVVCAMMLLAVAFTIGEGHPSNCIINMAACLLFVAFLCTAIIVQLQHAKKTPTTAYDFIPIIFLLGLLLVFLYTLGIHSPTRESITSASACEFNSFLPSFAISVS